MLILEEDTQSETIKHIWVLICYASLILTEIHLVLIAFRYFIATLDEHFLRINSCALSGMWDEGGPCPVRIRRSVSLETRVTKARIHASVSRFMYLINSVSQRPSLYTSGVRISQEKRHRIAHMLLFYSSRVPFHFKLWYKVQAEKELESLVNLRRRRVRVFTETSETQETLANICSSFNLILSWINHMFIFMHGSCFNVHAFRGSRTHDVGVAGAIFCCLSFRNEYTVKVYLKCILHPICFFNMVYFWVT